MTEKFYYMCEEWAGDSRDGVVIGGEGHHFFKMTTKGKIKEAYEVYESEEGEKIVTPLSDMIDVGWIKDLGFSNLDDLETIDKEEFIKIKRMTLKEYSDIKDI